MTDDKIKIHSMGSLLALLAEWDAVTYEQGMLDMLKQVGDNMVLSETTENAIREAYESTKYVS